METTNLRPGDGVMGGGPDGQEGQTVFKNPEIQESLKDP